MKMAFSIHCIESLWGCKWEAIYTHLLSLETGHKGIWKGSRQEALIKIAKINFPACKDFKDYFARCHYWLWNWAVSRSFDNKCILRAFGVFSGGMEPPRKMQRFWQGRHITPVTWYKTRQKVPTEFVLMVSSQAKGVWEEHQRLANFLREKKTCQKKSLFCFIGFEVWT